MEKRHKIFVAINLPGDIKKQLFLYSQKFLDLPARWVPKDNLHITLEFLGALTDMEIGEICVAVKEVAERHGSFTIELQKVLYGPPLRQGSAGQAQTIPKMVWVEGKKSKELAMIRQDLENTLTEKISFIPESRAFAPHITLARINAMEFRQIEPEEVPEINEVIDLAFTVESIEVMESEMRKGGPVYTILESHNLNN